MLKKQGVKSIVVLLHEGGVNAGTYQQCVGVSDPILTIAQTMTPRSTPSSPATPTSPYVCSIPDPAGNPRLVTSAASYGQVVTETDLVINTRSGEVDRGRSTATNHLVGRTVAKDADPDGDHRQVERPVRRRSAQRVVGTNAEDILGDSNGNRGIETPMGDLVADAILWGTKAPENGGAQIALHEHRWRAGQPDGTRRSTARARARSRTRRPTTSRRSATSYVALDLTGAQIKAVLEQQYHAGPAAWLAADAGARRLRGLHVHLGRHAAGQAVAGRAGLDDAQRHPDRPRGHLPRRHAELPGQRW